MAQSLSIPVGFHKKLSFMNDKLIITEGLYTQIKCTNCGTYIAASTIREIYIKEARNKGWLIHHDNVLCPTCNVSQFNPSHKQPIP